MSIETMTLPEIRERGHAALLRELGPAGYVRFMQQLVPGKGDYTRDRKKWIDNVNLDDVKNRVEARRAHAPKSRGGSRKNIKTKKTSRDSI